MHSVANVQVSAHAELSLKNRGSGQTSSACGCSCRLLQLPCRRLLLAVAAGLSPLHTLPSRPVPKRGFLAHLQGGSSHAGTAWGDVGDGVRFGTPPSSHPVLRIQHGDAGKAAGALGLARLQPPLALFVLHFPICKIGRRARGCGAGRDLQHRHRLSPRGPSRWTRGFAPCGRSSLGTGSTGAGLPLILV